MDVQYKWKYLLFVTGFHFFKFQDEAKNSPRVMKGSGKVKISGIRGSATLPTKSLQVEDGKTQKSEKQVRIGLLGASGYTGAEVCSTWV